MCGSHWSTHSLQAGVAMPLARAVTHEGSFFARTGELQTYFSYL